MILPIRLISIIAISCMLMFASQAMLAFEIGEVLCLGEKAADGSCKRNLKESPVNSPTGIVSSLLPNVYILAGIILFFLFVFGGFTVVTSGGNPEQTEKGKQALTWAVIGFLIIVSSYWIIQIIEVITGIKILQSGYVPGLGTPL